MIEQLSLWSHALAAMVLAAVALFAARRAPPAMPRWPLVAMLGLGAIWALAVAGVGAADPVTRMFAGLRDLSILGVMIALHRRSDVRPLGIAPVYGVVALVIVTSTLLQLVAITLGLAGLGEPVLTAATLLRMMVAVAALVLIHNLSVSHAPGSIRALCLALASLWAADLALATSAYLSGHWPPAMMAARGVAAALAGGGVALALRRGEHRPVAVSRMVAYQSLSLIAIGGYFALLALGTSALSAIGGENARLYQTAFVFGLTAAVLTLVSSSWLRAWLKVKIAKHFFSHRYDYRSEWLRFTGTLGTPEASAPLTARIVTAIADLTGSERGLLLVPEGEALGVGARWNWDGAGAGTSPAFARHLLLSERIVALDDLRAGNADAAELACTPQWMIDDPDVWAVVPMLHLGRLVGAVVVARPGVDRALDWEDFDLLKIAGRQVASYLAEARAQEALADGQRFDEFNRRFAFIVHDIKNLVSGLSLVARNAERHADNPEFRADMVATLQDSAAKLNMLLSRLSANPRGRAEADPSVAVPLLDFVRELAAARRDHPVVVGGDARAIALADRASLEQVVTHLVSNAIEASPAAEPVTIAVADERGQVTLSVIDRGCGMTPAFVRDQLFRPFVSSKPSGFGIGAYEARLLAEAMGGRISVDSREGAGTTFRVTLPAAHAQPLEAAA